MALVQGSLGGLDGASSPLPQPGRAVTLRADAVLTAAWVATDIVPVSTARRFTIYYKYTADAGGTANRAQIRVMASAEWDSDGTAPEVADDVWYPPVLVDSTPTATLLTGTKETGATMTVTAPEHGVIVARPMAITLGEPSDAGTDVWHGTMTFEVGPYWWVYVAAKELGDTDADQLGLLRITYNLSL